jgi:Ca2+/Na+ antiporter
MGLLQLLTNFNPMFLGLTIFAGAGSTGDYLSKAAKRGLSSTAVSGVLSGQLLNFFIGFSIAKIITSISNGEVDFNIFDLSESSFNVLSNLIVVIVIAMSFVYMVIMMFIIIRKK